MNNSFPSLVQPFICDYIFSTCGASLYDSNVIPSIFFEIRNSNRLKFGSLNRFRSLFKNKLLSLFPFKCRIRMRIRSVRYYCIIALRVELIQT